MKLRMKRYIVSKKVSHVTKEKEILESQLSILTEEDIDLFLQIDINEIDVVEATPEFLMIDSDHEDDENIDI